MSFVFKNWSLHAACASMDQDIFFEPGKANVRAAKMVCVDCPVRTQCLDSAVDPRDTQFDLTWAVRGGLTPKERREYLRVITHNKKLPATTRGKPVLSPAGQAAPPPVSHYRGVFWSGSSGRWRATIEFDHKRRHLGHYPPTVEGEKMAAMAYDAAALSFLGDKARLNFPIEAQFLKAGSA